MRKFRHKRGNIDRKDKFRAVLTDTAPSDIPIIISNDGFHANIKKPFTSAVIAEIRGAILDSKARYTIPYRYRIRLNTTTSRLLSLVHPSAQLNYANFYESYGHLIPYFCRGITVSLRSPKKIGSATFYSSRNSSAKRYKNSAIDTLIQDRVVRNPGSFFAYSGHDRLYKFFSSHEFLSLENTYSFMRSLDISKCFSSIYSHTLAWSVKDVKHGKDNVSASSFANDFDSAMRYSNYNETNGIPVGSEVSRIFAEIILQAIDADVLRTAKRHGLTHERDFHIFRYVDDYVIFSHTTSDLDRIERAVADCLGRYNLHLNDSKSTTYSRPFLTKKSQLIFASSGTITELRNHLFATNSEKDAKVLRDIGPPKHLLNKFTLSIKSICTAANAKFDDISPYIIGALKSILEEVIESHEKKKQPDTRTAHNLLSAFDFLLSAIFFFFTVHVTVPTSYQLARCVILTIRFFKKYATDYQDSINERVRLLLSNLLRSPTVYVDKLSNCAPIEILNLILASSELPKNFRLDISDIEDEIFSREEIDYFSYISLIFYHGGTNRTFRQDVEELLDKRYLSLAEPRVRSCDAHFMLDLICCPYLSLKFRYRALNALLENLGIARVSGRCAWQALEELLQNPWFVNWRQIDLLNHLVKKELSFVY